MGWRMEGIGRWNHNQEAMNCFIIIIVIIIITITIIIIIRKPMCWGTALQSWLPVESSVVDHPSSSNRGLAVDIHWRYCTMMMRVRTRIRMMMATMKQ